MAAAAAVVVGVALDERPNTSAWQTLRHDLSPSVSPVPLFSSGNGKKLWIGLLWLEDCTGWRARIKNEQAMLDVTQASS